MQSWRAEASLSNPMMEWRQTNVKSGKKKFILQFREGANVIIIFAACSVLGAPIESLGKLLILYEEELTWDCE